MWHSRLANSLWHDRFSIIRTERGRGGGGATRRQRRRVFLVELYRARSWVNYLYCTYNHKNFQPKYLIETTTTFVSFFDTPNIAHSNHRLFHSFDKYQYWLIGRRRFFFLQKATYHRHRVQYNLRWMTIARRSKLMIRR